MPNEVNVFARLIKDLSLSDEHMEELKIKRGFSENVIKELKFRSAGIHTQKLDYVTRDMYEILKYDKIIIPFISASGEVISARPHKLGFKNVPLIPYVPYAVMNEDKDTIVISEGEFKAIASCILGINSIATLGISSFSKSKFNELLTIVNNIGSKNVVICFDNEIKDDPNFPNYKQDFTKRYDTFFYAYVIAAQFKSAGYNSKIAVIPKEWMVNGKADIDGCLAQNMSREQYYEIIKNSLSPNEYKESWNFPKAHISMLERRVDAWFYDGNIRENFNCYYFKKGKDEEKISNFVIKVLNTIYSDKGTERYCQFVSRYGNSDRFILTPDMMASRSSFVKMCYEMGDYDFKGNDSILPQIWSYLFMKQDGITIKKLMRYGYDEESQTWFFGNGAYRNGNYFEVNPDGIVWIDGQGFKMFKNAGEKEEKQFSQSSEKDEFEPILNQDAPKFSINDIYKNLATGYGDNYAQLLLGWTLGIFFMPDIIREFNVYPFLFLHGRVGRGKSTIANWVTSFFGYNQKGFPFHSSSAVGITRVTSQSSMLPVWLEEYRNKDSDILKKNNYLRSVYDRSTVIKGTKNADEIKSYKARSTIILSGEEFPNDSALNSRCIMFPVQRPDPKEDEKEKRKEAYAWMERNKKYFNYFGHHLLTNYRIYWPKIQENIKKYVSNFDSNMDYIASRIKIQTSIMGGICEAIMSNDPNFTSFISGMALKFDMDRSAEEALNVFFNDINELYGMGQIGFQFFRTEKVKVNGVEKNYMHLWFHGLYNLWEQKYLMKGLRSDMPASRKALYDHIKGEKYFVAYDVKRIIEKKLRIITLDMDNFNFPLPLRDIVSMADQPRTLGEYNEYQETNGDRWPYPEN